MGFAKYAEDISDRYYESIPLGNGDSNFGPNPPKIVPLGSQIAALRCLIREFWNYYNQQQPLHHKPHGSWEGHFLNVQKLHTLLAPVNQVHEKHPNSWNVVDDIKSQLLDFFQNSTGYGLWSRSVFQRVISKTDGILLRCRKVIRDLNQFSKDAQAKHLEKHEEAEIAESLKQLYEIKEPLSRNLKEFEEHKALAKETQGFWDRFLKLFTVLAVQRRYRPALKHLDRFHLNEQQERFVTTDHKGGFRIQGASGSGKTIILIHRALRLAYENPTRKVRIFTINRALAELLRSAVVATCGQLPNNLDVAAYYDFLREIVCLFKPGEHYRLVDERSGERIVNSWCDFYKKLSGQNARQCPIEHKKARILIGSIEVNENSKLEAGRYLREEMVYIQSAYRKQDRQQYLSDHRRSRSITFRQSHKEICLNVLHAWEEYLEEGDLCDIDGLTLLAADYFEEPTHLARIRKELPTDFVLVDEVQDFSTLELAILRKLVLDPEGPNRFFLVGDLNQKVYPKHHDPRRSGFNFQGRAGILKQNFRNTRQILQAAYNLPKAFPPMEDEEEEAEVISPDLSIYEGGRPIVLECTPDTHLRRILDIIKLRGGDRIAVVSENDQLLREIRSAAVSLGFRCHELLRNEDLDKWRNQGDSLVADLVVSRLEAVKGFEFDTVIACDLSHGVIPRQGLPEEELWRQAAVLYAALTRARDELVITYLGKPSRFVKAMLADVELHKTIDETTLQQILALG